MLKKLRVALSLLIFTLLTFYSLDFAGILPSQFHALGHIQFFPALLSHNAGIITFLAVLVLLFGRIYCSAICPMGTFQDVIGRKKKFAYRKNNRMLRWSIVAACIIAFFSGFTVVAGMLDPYSMHGRIAVHLFKPVYMFGNNILASVFGHFGSYAFYKTSVGILSIFSFAVALAAFAAIGTLAYAKGRLYCNTICPVGTIMGFLSKLSFFKIRIDKGKCVSCGVCEKRCKASCIDAKSKTIDYTRCVNCFDCINSCNRKGISFSASRPSVDKGRRRFLFAAMAAPAVLAKAEAAGTGKNVISPPGSVSVERLLRRCSSCHLCISKCPSHVLEPAFLEYGFGGMMMPKMSFEKGFCNYDCVICTRVCPSDALLPLSVEQKHKLQVGKVVFIPEICVVHTDGTSCGACSEHCPTQAVRMVPYKNGLTAPSIDADICVGCGGCEYICPVRPKRAIYVEGNSVHKEAKPFEAGKKDEIDIIDFGF